MNRIAAIKIFTLTSLFSLLIPVLIQDGMFLDGVTYSAISKNLANGFGSYFEPHYSKTLYLIFNDLQSISVVLVVLIINSILPQIHITTKLRHQIYWVLR